MNYKFNISSDSTCDLTQAHIQKNNIYIAPLTIILGEKEYLDDIDIHADDVVKYVAGGGSLPKTSAVSVEDYIELFTKLTEGGKGVLHFSISSKDSSCYDHALLASKKFENVYVVDTLQLSSGQGLLVMKGVDYREEGLTCKEAFEKIESIKRKANTSFVIDRLDFLHKGGRCSLLALMGAKLLKLHPYITMIDGSLKVKKKYMGNMIRAVEQYVIDLATEYKNYDKKRCFITHSPTDSNIIDAVKVKVKELFDFEVVEETFAGTTVTSHCGYNTIGVLFITE